jgi:hypothetical protein
MGKRDFGSVRRAVLKCLESRSEILAAYIFGSVVTGRTRPDSDIDVAVLVSGNVMRKDPWKYRLGLTADLMAALKRDDIDLILLNQAPPLLAHRVLSKGKLILERSPSARVSFQVRAVNRYLDTQPMRNLFLAYLKKQVREGKILG